MVVSDVPVDSESEDRDFILLHDWVAIESI